MDQKECQNAEVFPQSSFNETHQIWMRTEKYGGSWQLALGRRWGGVKGKVSDMHRHKISIPASTVRRLNIK